MNSETYYKNLKVEYERLKIKYGQDYFIKMTLVLLNGTSTKVQEYGYVEPDLIGVTGLDSDGHLSTIVCHYSLCQFQMYPVPRKQDPGAKEPIPIGQHT